MESKKVDKVEKFGVFAANLFFALILRCNIRAYLG